MLLVMAGKMIGGMRTARDAGDSEGAFGPEFRWESCISTEIQFWRFSILRHFKRMQCKCFVARAFWSRSYAPLSAISHLDRKRPVGMVCRNATQFKVYARDALHQKMRCLCWRNDILILLSTVGRYRTKFYIKDIYM